MIRSLILITIYCLSVRATCNKRFDCITQVYSFETSLKVYPDLDSININDTIWLEYSFPVSLRDINTGNIIDYSNADNLGIAIDFLKFNGGSVENPGVSPAANDFTYNIIHGVFVPDSFLPDTNKDYRFVEMSNEYRFKLGIIPQQKGIYGIAISNAVNVYRKNDKCTKATFTITFTDTDQHLYFYEQNRPGYMLSEYERTHIYCFKVI